MDACSTFVAHHRKPDICSDCLEPRAAHTSSALKDVPLTMAPLAGRVALVTGSSSGIGLAVAAHLFALGASVCAHGIEPADHPMAVAAIETIRAEGQTKGGGDGSRSSPRVAYFQADVGSAAGVEQLIESCEGALGPVDVLVNNAGIQYVAPIEKFPVEKFEAILNINLSAVWHATRRVIGRMKETGWGRVINICSAHGLVASPCKSAYVAAKHGVLGMTKAVALEAAQSGNVTVNAVCPGYVLTPLVERQIPETAAARGISEEAVRRDVLLAAQPTKRFVGLDEVAAAVGYLSGDTARSVTGTSISVDGGWTAQ
eukprot:TRINITY_DN14021_c0_g1_i1.p1 TRINITY_DN14021_c0_g1~~TRINITY_DN14021_c0_g1_i1.p1  ORF type:complete len:315 (+),score=64.95 TRINITY_DN14021_c0_g1_i1:124-1068(+)